MKVFKQILSAILVLLMVISTITIAVTAKTTDESKYIYGDVDLNGKVDVRDATLIQKTIAKIVEITEVQSLLGDVDASGKLNIKDATEIQKWIAHLSNNSLINRVMQSEQADNDATGDESATKDESSTVDEASTQDEAKKDESTKDEFITFDQKDFTTKDSLQSFSGKYHSNSDTVEIEYKIEVFEYSTDDEYMVVAQTGEVDISSNAWSLKDIRLLPGDNKITIMLYASENNYLEASINVFYDRGTPYTPNEENIASDDETGITYVNNIIKISIDSDMKKTDLDNIVDSIDGKIVGSINAINQYHIEVRASSLDELYFICEELNENEDIILASIDSLVDIDSSSLYVPYDPWAENSENAIYDEECPAGNNWWIEATEIFSAWQYNRFFNKINIGIVDDGVYTKHEDLNVKFTSLSYQMQNSSVLSSHGTAVAGVISALHNNDKGLSGVINQNYVDLYSVDYTTTNVSQFIGRCFSSSYEDYLVSLVEAGVKIINYSCNGVHDSFLDPKEKTIESLTLSMAKLIEKGYDFLIVNSAGNNSKDAKKAGPFSMINEDTYTDKARRKTGVAFSEIYNRILIVANAKYSNGNYVLAKSSNYGKRIDIVAPGTDIYTTVNDNKYDLLNGTSFAAPIVTGVAGLVWSVNPNFTGREVASIVCNSVDENVIVSSNPENENDTGTYTLVNAKIAVETAIRETYGDILPNVCTVRFVDASTKTPVSAKSVVYKGAEKIKSIDFCESFVTQLSNGTFRLVVTPTSDKYESVVVNFEQDRSGINTLIVELEPKCDFIYRIENDTVIITGYKGDGGDITIPSYIESLSVVKIDSDAFYKNKTITSVTFEGDLTAIGSNAFKNCSSLQEVNITGSVVCIEGYAFYNCSNLIKFWATNGVSTIGQGAFSSCKLLTAFGVQSSIQYIGNMAFLNCTALSDFEYPKSADVNKYAFMGTNTQYKNDWIKF